MKKMYYRAKTFICYIIKANLSIFYRKKIENRIKRKKKNQKKINVIFVCWRPSVWESLRPIYEKLSLNVKFNVKIVVIPNKKQLPNLGLSHEEFEIEGNECFWRNYNYIKGYDEKTKIWLNIKELKPDYVFFQQPYNITKHKYYKSGNVSKYAKICYVPYYGLFAINNVYVECTPKDFMRDVSYYYAQTLEELDFLNKNKKKFFLKDTEILFSGYPRFYSMLDYKNTNSNIWLQNKKTFRIIWNTRWTTNEGNCNFFKYKDTLYELCSNNPKIDFVYRPHPQAFQEWNSTGEFTKEQQSLFREQYNSKNNMHIDESNNYYPLIFSSDLLISDYSSFMLDYLMTEKPIIYCETKNCSFIGNDMGAIDYVTYKVHNWIELKQKIYSIMSGEDPLKESRIKAKQLYVNPNNDPSSYIVRSLMGE